MLSSQTLRHYNFTSFLDSISPERSFYKFFGLRLSLHVLCSVLVILGMPLQSLMFDLGVGGCCIMFTLAWLCLCLQNTGVSRPRFMTYESRWWTTAWVLDRDPSEPIKNARSMSGTPHLLKHKFTYTNTKLQELISFSFYVFIFFLAISFSFLSKN